MSDENEGTRTVDGITADGINAFVSERFGIALVVKPDLTEGDLFKWGNELSFDDSKPLAVARSLALRGAVKAGIITHCTDKPTAANVSTINAQHAQWYGSKLLSVYQRYTFIDPN